MPPATTTVPATGYSGIRPSATERQVQGHSAIEKRRESVVLVEGLRAGILCIDE